MFIYNTNVYLKNHIKAMSTRIHFFFNPKIYQMELICIYVNYPFCVTPINDP